MNPVTEDNIFVMFDILYGIKCIQNNLVKAGKFKLPYGMSRWNTIVHY